MTFPVMKDSIKLPEVAVLRMDGDLHTLKLKRSLRIVVFALLLISPISTLLSPLEPSRLSLLITWLHNALIYSGISLFGLYFGKLLRSEDLKGRLLSSVVIPTLVGNLVFNVMVYVSALASSGLMSEPKDVQLLVLAFLTILLLEVMGILRLYFDRRISNWLELAKVKTSRGSVLLLTLIFIVSALFTNEFMWLGDRITTSYGSASSVLVRTYVNAIPALGVLPLIFILIWYLDDELEIS